MKKISIKLCRALRLVLLAFASTPVPVFGFQGPLESSNDPWSYAASALAFAFSGRIGIALATVAIVVAGLVFMFSHGGTGKQVLAGVIFGGGMVLGAVRFMNWLFPGTLGGFAGSLG